MDFGKQRCFSPTVPERHTQVWSQSCCLGSTRRSTSFFNVLSVYQWLSHWTECWGKSPVEQLAKVWFSVNLLKVERTYKNHQVQLIIWEIVLCRASKNVKDSKKEQQEKKLWHAFPGTNKALKWFLLFWKNSAYGNIIFIKIFELNLTDRSSEKQDCDTNFLKKVVSQLKDSTLIFIASRCFTHQAHPT